ncbi:phosphoribosyltransferase family protein [Pseudonocardia sp. 73-21]|jgi:putative phosphoribosyl transferase|uniref:phosphoribosyltransferase family protein n=1 Tax=Pseudonocardia sp. 73-21 TaxID=1895809 RepID=UPI00095DB3A2|nr:phosphoribosyltransferase family protein [Pseudonocardia sp. 73-21]OJY51984.1 MAG: phosphoribosyl transferase [Pseudonocardia sp. 73-21]
MPFVDRVEAGRRLAGRLTHLRDEDVVVLGLPRGGVPVAFEVARVLGAPLDVIVVRKLGVPSLPELAMGAVGEDGVLVVDSETVRRAHVGEAELAELERRERVEVQRRAQLFRAGRPRIPLAGRTAVLVDDGIATGATARAACRVARAHGAARVVLVAPVCARETAIRLRDEVDELDCLEVPDLFDAVGRFYVDFTPTSEEEVVELLRRAAGGTPAGPGSQAPPPPGRDVEVAVPGRSLHGHLTVPEGPLGVVVFAHGSGSGRLSPRNRRVAAVLQRAGLATLLLDLLSPREERDRANVFDVDLLAVRLAGATAWVRRQPGCEGLPVALFGASTGAAAALWAAADPDADIAAVVSRGGRPDMAVPRLGQVRAPTLLIVGGADTAVLELNRRALAAMRCEARLAVVPGATHLFEEPGTLEQVADLARDWFVTHVTPASQPVG